MFLCRLSCLNASDNFSILIEMRVAFGLGKVHTSADEPKRCRCELTAVQSTVVKDGVNKGRKFWTCPNHQNAKCGFFEWAEDESDLGGTVSASAGRAQSLGGDRPQNSGGCFKVSTISFYCSEMNPSIDSNPLLPNSAAEKVTGPTVCHTCAYVPARYGEHTGSCSLSSR